MENFICYTLQQCNNQLPMAIGLLIVEENAQTEHFLVFNGFSSTFTVHQEGYVKPAGWPGGLSGGQSSYTV